MSNESQPEFYSRIFETFGINALPSIPDHKGTIFEACEGVPLNSLSNKVAEKAVVEIFGFEPTPEFSRVLRGTIIRQNNRDPEVVLDIYEKKCGHDGMCAIKNILKDGNQVGLRITQKNATNQSTIPFIRFDSLDDYELILNEKRSIVGWVEIESTDPKTGNPSTWKIHNFENRDKVEIFIDPKPITRLCLNENNRDPVTGQPIQELVKLGGGFVLQLESINPQTNVASFSVEAITNDVNVRDVNSRKPLKNSLSNDSRNHFTQEYKHRFQIDLDIDLKTEELKLTYEQPGISDLLTNPTVYRVCEYAVATMVKRNGPALFRTFGTLLELHPDTTGAHAIKSHFCLIDKDEGPQMVTFVFDIETAAAESEIESDVIIDNPILDYKKRLIQGHLTKTFPSEKIDRSILNQLEKFSKFEIDSQRRSIIQLNKNIYDSNLPLKINRRIRRSLNARFLGNDDEKYTDAIKKNEDLLGKLIFALDPSQKDWCFFNSEISKVGFVPHADVGIKEIIIADQKYYLALVDVDGERYGMMISSWGKAVKLSPEYIFDVVKQLFGQNSITKALLNSVTHQE